MPLLDVVLPAMLICVALASLRSARRRRALRMPIADGSGTSAWSALAGLVALSGSAAAQLIVAGWRWQLAPAAVAAVLLAAVLLVRAFGRPAMLAGAIPVLALVGATLSLTLTWAFPVHILPIPDGPHAVGTTTVVIRDDQRTERYGPTPGDAREIVVQLWYPTAAGSAVERAPLVPQAAAFTGLGATELGLPRFALSHVGLIPSNATLDAPALDAPLPVALLAHGWTGFRTIQTDLAEQLASLGWVVAAADHRYGALVTTFPDGRADLFDSEALPEFGTVPEDLYAERSRQLVRTFADDLALILRTLEHDPPGPLEGVLDLAAVAFLGHSTGGGAAVAACAVEPRCAATVGFDPWLEPVDSDVLERGTARPLLSLRTEDWIDRPNELTLQALHRTQRERGDVEAVVTLEGALHRDFTLLGALSPAARLLGFAGDTPSAQTRAATITWTARFLDHHVRGVGDDPLVEAPETPVGRIEAAS
jgi:dienelactone hydrolase